MGEGGNPGTDAALEDVDGPVTSSQPRDGLRLAGLKLEICCRDLHC